MLRPSAMLALPGLLACLALGRAAETVSAPENPASFLQRAEKELAEHAVLQMRAEWINETYITEDTDALAALFGARGTELSVRLAKEAAKHAPAAGLSFDQQRKLNLLKQRIVLPAPDRPGAAEELNLIATALKSQYGKGKGALDGRPVSGSDLEEKMGTVRDPVKLKEMWTTWHDNVGGPMRSDYARLVQIANEGARELGYADAGVLWRSGYDMPPDDFAREMDRLWLQVKPLYDQLHCYVRARLSQHYGPEVQPPSGPIRADLLGNMWAQEWGNIYSLVAPPGAGDVGYDLAALLVSKGYDAIKMVRTAEAFFTSLGLPALPQTFWDRSLFVKPQDREVVCHASAWNLDHMNDLRIKMCIKVNADDFVTVHHELGHNYYDRAYNQQPYLYKSGANDGFHEAIGDFLALSITPEYLVQIGLLDPAKAPSADKDIGLLLRQALDKIAFLPFGLLMDKWRWQVFSGAVPPEQYQASWEELRRRYQGIVSPSARPPGAFDPGAKFHIPASVPYARYFLASILQFQFYRSAAEQTGWNGPLHRCSFYGNRAVGARLEKLLSMGASRPWPDALEAFTGARQMDGSALVEYFRPLMAWLEQQNQGRATGW